MNHSPLPWEIWDDDVETDILRPPAYEDEPEGERVVATVRAGNTETNAAFIVRACNCHEELVQMLEAMLTLYVPQNEGLGARALLRKAKGQSCD